MNPLLNKPQCYTGLYRIQGYTVYSPAEILKSEIEILLQRIFILLTICRQQPQNMKLESAIKLRTATFFFNSFGPNFINHLINFKNSSFLLADFSVHKMVGHVVLACALMVTRLIVGSLSRISVLLVTGVGRNTACTMGYRGRA